MNESPDVAALNMADIAARVDGMRIRGQVVGLALVQVANAPGRGVTIRGQADNTLIRRSFMPDLDMRGLHGEDLGIPENCMPRLQLDECRIVRLTAARNIMPGSSCVQATTPRANFQKADLRNSDLGDFNATGGFFEESDISGSRTNAGTNLRSAHLMDCKRTGVTLHAENVPEAEFGPAGPGLGNKRASMRERQRLASLTAPRVIG